jgi:nitrite reductase/ring-hydroxylating ferredoxin subunit
MMQERSPPCGPDLTQGVTLAEFLGGKLAGHVGDEEVLLIHSGTEIFAIAAHCSHYHGPLAEGLVVGDSIRCPWHHACFDLRSGEAVRAPAIRSGRSSNETAGSSFIRSVNSGNRAATRSLARLTK